MRNNHKKPNILLLCSDQHNPYILGCYGDSLVHTPNLDRLAGGGMTFDSAYCNSPLCVPSRMSFLTGMYPYECDALHNGSTLNSIIPTYAHMLGAAGYHTVLSGRMHFMGPDQRHGFMERLVGDVASYTHWKGEIDYSGLGDLGNMSKPDPLLTVGAGNTFDIDYDQKVAKETCKWLRHYQRRKVDMPFLMTAGFFNPHCPYIAPRELFDKYYEKVPFSTPPKEEIDALHPFHKAYRRVIGVDDVPDENMRKAKVAYYGLVELLDGWIGMILNTLEETGLGGDTIVVYFSDHGEMLGEHGRWHKGCFFEESVRVPLIIRMPGQENTGGRISEVVSLLDLLPTVCEWGDADMFSQVSGKSLIPLMNGITDSRENIVKAEYYDRGCNRMARKGKWKLCFYGNYEDCELYDLESDPYEKHNRADDPICRQVVEELKELVFSDGWNTDVLEKSDDKLNKHRYYEMISNFGNTANNSPLLTKLPDCLSQR
ncbi:MAG: sulfatase-like hydrolase/transferase [Kiritimatiellaeota bacterium]|nr:sulfatase-like hydrolase/transferase [Kiritimatiellota bacterium]